MTNQALSPRPTAKKTWHFARWLVPMLSLPFLVGTIAIGWLGFREVRATQALRELNAPQSSSNTSTGDVWMDENHRASTSTVGTAMWSKIYLLMFAANYQDQKELPLVGSKSLWPILDRKRPWEEDEPVANYLTEMRPVIDLIHQAAQLPTPVWQPLAFNGLSTLLPEPQEARNVSRLLQLEAEYALYHGDSQRALKAIDSLHATAEAIGWNISVPAQLYHLSMQDPYLRTIQRSLHTDVWSSEQLDLLLGQIDQPIDVADSFRRGLKAEQASVDSVLNSSLSEFAGSRLMKFPSAKLELQRQYLELQALADSANVRLSTHVHERENGIGRYEGAAGMLVNYYLPIASAYAAALDAKEQLRQVTGVAVAVKRFQLEHQRFPEDLSELSKTGLSTEDWTVVGVGRLGYGVEGDRAYVWGLGPQDSTIAAERPTLETDDNEIPYHMAVVVRSVE